MKKTMILGFLMTALVWSAYAQQNTNYGTGTVSIGSGNSFFGYYAGHDVSASSWGNSFFGEHSGRYTMSGHGNSYFGGLCGSGNETGNYNTAMGYRAHIFNETGSLNVAIGYASLEATFGDENTAVGAAAMRENRFGLNNTAVGSDALHFNQSSRNTAMGRRSLYNNTTGHSNTANGYHSLQANTTGYYNVAIGSEAMYANMDGNSNTATGYFALANNTSGSYNCASGLRALQYNSTGVNNTGYGSKALYFVTTGSNNTAVGYAAGPSIADLSNTTAIGYSAVPTASNQVRIGNSAVTSIGGQVSWSTFSDGRFKNDIKEDVSGLAFIKQLRPVSYVVDKTAVNKFLHIGDSSDNQAEARSISLRQTGFVAQEVEAVVKKTGYVFYGVDVPKNENDHYSIRYAEFVVPLVKAVQELSTNVEEQKKLIEQQQKQIEVLIAGMNSKMEIGNTEVGGTSRSFLQQNNPNPFTSETEIRMTLRETVAQATIMIYNLEGREMKNIAVNDRGEVSVKISGNEIPAGMYLYTLIADGKAVDTKRMILTQR